MTNLNLYPYYDDYDKLKDFYKILFKPGIPVQARELTQIQSILQEQVSRFGDNIFTNGSRVTGAKITVNTNVFSVVLAPNQNVSSLQIGQYIQGQTNGLVAEIVDIISTISNTILVYVPRGNSSRGFIFGGNETIVPYTDATLVTIAGSSVISDADETFQIVATGNKGETKLTVTALSGLKVGSFLQAIGVYVIGIESATNTLTLSNSLPYSVSNITLDVFNRSSHPCLMIGVGEGIFYVNGVFSRVGSQSIVPDFTNRWTTASIGLVLQENIVTSDSDSTLLDPAQGSYNYNAPGADRLQYVLDLVSYEDSETKDSSFIELVRIENGVIIRQNDYSTYAEIMNTIARRTFDQSGNYVVDPFIISLVDAGDDQTFNAVINPGKAYVNGFEFKTIAPYTLKINRSLDTETTTNFGLDTYLGNYFIITNVTGPIPVAGTSINIKKGAVTVGTGVLMQISPSATGLQLYLSNINGDITGATSVSYNTFSATISGSIVDGLYKKLVFPTPQSYVKNIKNLNYTISRLYKNVVFTNGSAIVAALNTNERFVGGSGILPNSVANANYAVFNTGSTLSQVDVKTVAAGALAQFELSLVDSTYNGTGDIEVKVQINNDAGRIKTLTTVSTSVSNVGTTAVSLKKSDFYKLIYASVIPSGATFKGEWSSSTAYVINDIVNYNNVLYSAIAANSNATPDTSTVSWVVMQDVSSTITVDNGQRDMWYDHSSITSSTPYANLAIVFSYFKHTGAGPLTVDSYPIDYSSIPSYGDILLRDSIDLRPRRTDDTTAFGFDSISIADEIGVEVDITYYLSRIDKIVLSNNRAFYTISGVSSYNTPLPPADIPDAMTIATLVLPPYTDDVKKIRVDITNNKRYTMRDIGKLEQRVGNIEYYTSLNSLENKVISSVQYSPTGVELFKSGFLTDSFDSFSVGNVNSSEYKCSIDTSAGICRPQFKMNATSLAVNSSLTTSKVNSSLVTLPYTKEIFVDNRKATSYMNINPFNVLGNIGIATIAPSSDYWFDTKSLPVINVINENTAAFSAAQQEANAYNQSAKWSAWKTIWTGNPVTTQSGYIQKTTTDIKQQRFKTEQVVGESQIVNSDNTVIVSREIQPYARSNTIKFTVNGLTPYSHVFVWIDDKMVNSYVTPDKNPLMNNSIQSISVTSQGSGYTHADVVISGGSGTGATAKAIITDGKITSVVVTYNGSGYTTAPTIIISGDGTGATAVASLTQPSIGDPLITDYQGSCTGILHFPNDENFKFACGKHRIVFGDTFEKALATSYADVTYTAEGYISTKQETIVSTRVPVTTTTTVNDYTTSTSVSIRDLTPEPVYTPPASNSNISTTTPPVNGVYSGIDSNNNKPLGMFEFTSKVTTYYPQTLNTVPAATLNSILTTISKAYNESTSATSARAVGNQVGLPDTAGAAYWANQIITGKIAVDNISSAIAAAARSNGETSINKCAVDPLAQSFIISAEQLPNGCFVSEIDVFFASKDTSMPVIMELRPLVNGYPSSNTIIPMSTIVKNPSEINTSENGTVSTTFTFVDPIYLAPGEYAVILKTGSNKYNVFISEMNKVQIGTTTVVSDQPYVGSLFESQNASTWTAEQFKDLCFTLKICKFDIGNTTLALKNNEIDMNADLINLNIQNIQPNGTSLSTNVVLPSYSGNIPLNQDVIMPTQFSLNNVGDGNIYVTMTTKDSHVSPVIDLERVSMICVENIIGSITDITVDETDSKLGDAKAKYVTKKVTLNQGFNASSLVTYLNINRPAGSSIAVYARFQNEFDSGVIENKQWVLLNQESNGGNTSQQDQYVEDTWSIYDYSYNGFTNFNQFEVKIVFYSTNTSKVPVIADLRAIALA